MVTVCKVDNRLNILCEKKKQLEIDENRLDKFMIIIYFVIL